MEVIVTERLLAERAHAARQEGSRALPLVCSLGSPVSREPVLLARRVWQPREALPPLRLYVRHAPRSLRHPRAWQYLAQHLHPQDPGTAVLWLGRGAEAGEFVGVAKQGEWVEPVRVLRLIGPGLPRVTAVDFTETRTPTAPDLERWSRRIGALDLQTCQRVWTMRVVVAGEGRMAAKVAGTLARWGAPLTLIGPDRVERHNLDAGEGLTPADLGRPKAEALAEYLLRLGTGAPVEAVVARIQDEAARPALADAELLIGCVDNDAARAFLGRWARCNGLPLLDFGASVRREGDRWRAGADVRLVVPGDGCLLCLGRLAAGEADQGGGDWRQQRAGSLEELNGCAAGAGLLMLTQFLAGRRGQSAWGRLELDGEAGWPELQTVPRTSLSGCPGCAENFSGWDGNELA